MIARDAFPADMKSLVFVHHFRVHQQLRIRSSPGLGEGVGTSLIPPLPLDEVADSVYFPGFVHHNDGVALQFDRIPSDPMILLKFREGPADRDNGSFI